jgi:hypothetical protein
MGGEAGSRLAQQLAMPTSPDTLLRRVKQCPDEPVPIPRIIGIDDWAWRKGRRYGTIIIDLERSKVLDLLPDRESQTLQSWLKDQPQIEVISRDRSGTYAQAASAAAPQAKQVADRWHLLKNLRETVERLFERCSGRIQDALATLQPLPSGHPRSCLTAYPPGMVSPVPCLGGMVHAARSTTRFPQGTVLARRAAPLQREWT